MLLLPAILMALGCRNEDIGGGKMGFEIATASAEDVVRIVGWADDEGWNPGNTDRLPSSPSIPAPS